MARARLEEIVESGNQAAHAAPQASFRERKGWGLSEALFFLVLTCAMAAVVYCGRFAYREAMLLEDAKANGQAVAAWAERVAEAHAKGEAVSPSACGPTSDATDAEPAHWQACREALLGPEGPLAALRNPFNADNTVLGTKCERMSAATRGHVLVHKGTQPPQGMSGNMTFAPLEAKDALAKGTVLRIQVCDAGGYAIRVAEVTL